MLRSQACYIFIKNSIGLRSLRNWRTWGCCDSDFWVKIQITTKQITPPNDIPFDFLYILNWNLNRQFYDLNLQNDQALLFVCIIFVVDKFLLVPYLFPPGFFPFSLTQHTRAFDLDSFQISKS